MLSALFFALLALLIRAATAAATPEVCELRYVTPATVDSRSCLGCHDGTVAPLAEVTFPDELEGFGSGPPGARAHPVEVDYQQAALRHPGSLAPIGALPAELPLTAGRVTCLTCHDADSGEPFRVTLPLDGSALCMACHRY